MSETSQSKMQKPHAHFESPHEVLTDPALSKPEKVVALENLEQDARQLSTASGEGMAGGEPANLHEVLDAKEALELPPTAYAYEVVLRDLRLRQAATPRDGTEALIHHAIEALDALQRATAAASAGSPAPGLEAEIAEEAELEKLDP